jgi:hypothetical protein
MSDVRLTPQKGAAAHHHNCGRERSEKAASEIPSAVGSIPSLARRPSSGSHKSPGEPHSSSLVSHVLVEFMRRLSVEA